MGRSGGRCRGEPRWFWDARRFATRHSCFSPEDWLAKNRLGAAHRASLRWAAPVINEQPEAREPKGCPSSPPRSYSPEEQKGGRELGGCSSEKGSLVYVSNHVQGGGRRRLPKLGSAAPRHRTSPLLRRRIISAEAASSADASPRISSAGASIASQSVQDSKLRALA